MTGEKKIVGLWSGVAQGDDPIAEAEHHVDVAAKEHKHSMDMSPDMIEVAAPAAPFPDAEDPMDSGSHLAASPAPNSHLGWMAAALSITWVGFVLVAATDNLARFPAVAEWPSLLGTIAAPIAVILLLWQMYRNSSQAEYQRFSRLAATIRSENQALSQSMQQLNQHLTAARRQLEEQAGIVQQLGLDTVLRLNESSDALAARAVLLSEAGGKLSGSTDSALQRMDGLLSGLPRIDDVAQRLSSNFREAGLVAHQHGAQLEAKLAAIGEESTRAAEQAEHAIANLEQNLASLRQLSEDTQNGLTSAAQKVAEVQGASLSAMSRGTGAVQKQLEETSDRLSESLENMWQNFRAGVDKAADHLNAEMDKARAAGDALTAQLSSHGTQGDELTAQMQQLVAGFTAQLQECDKAVEQSSLRMDRAIASTTEKLDAFTANVGSSNRSAQQLISHSDALLLALDSVTRELDETLPLAFERLDAHEKTAEQAVARLKPLLEASELVAQSTLSHIHAAEKTLRANDAHLVTHAEKQEEMTERLRMAIRDSEASLLGLREEAGRFAEDSGAQILSVLQRVREAAISVTEDAGLAIASLAAENREAMEKNAATAVDDVFRAEMLSQLEAIELASHRAVAAANSAAERLTQQLTSVLEVSEAIEARTAEAEKSITAVDRDTLAKQVGLLTEALKSTAIDMTKTLSSEVSDSAWEAYLRGDRGVFARRAVKLLDHSDAREILRLYQSDSSFFTSVNQFIHDFEAMLRMLMNARDGSSVSVTLLSSDIGKLYVVLAQAIERLRN